jgi:hypothetical protein
MTTYTLKHFVGNNNFSIKDGTEITILFLSADESFAQIQEVNSEHPVPQQAYVPTSIINGFTPKAPIDPATTLPKTGK